MIKIPTRFWRAPIGSARTKPVSFVERGFQEQYAYEDNDRLNEWMRRTVEDKQREFRGKLKSPAINLVWRPEARITMGSSDMSPETVYNIIERLGDPLTQVWETAKRTIEGKNHELWFDACSLWKRGDLRPTVTPRSKSSTATRYVSTAP